MGRHDRTDSERDEMETAEDLRRDDLERAEHEGARTGLRERFESWWKAEGAHIANHTKPRYEVMESAWNAAEGPGEAERLREAAERLVGEAMDLERTDGFSLSVS